MRRRSVTAARPAARPLARRVTAQGSAPCRSAVRFPPARTPRPARAPRVTSTWAARPSVRPRPGRTARPWRPGRRATSARRPCRSRRRPARPGIAPTDCAPSTSSGTFVSRLDLVEREDVACHPGHVRKRHETRAWADLTEHRLERLLPRTTSSRCHSHPRAGDVQRAEQAEVLLVGGHDLVACFEPKPGEHDLAARRRGRGHRDLVRAWCRAARRRARAPDRESRPGCRSTACRSRPCSSSRFSCATIASTVSCASGPKVPALR